MGSNSLSPIYPPRNMKSSWQSLYQIRRSFQKSWSLTWKYWTNPFINVFSRLNSLFVPRLIIFTCRAVLDTRIRSSQDPREEGVLLLIREAITDIMTTVLHQAVKVDDACPVPATQMAQLISPSLSLHHSTIAPSTLGSSLAPHCRPKPSRRRPGCSRGRTMQTA